MPEPTIAQIPPQHQLERYHPRTHLPILAGLRVAFEGGVIVQYLRPGLWRQQPCDDCGSLGRRVWLIAPGVRARGRVICFNQTSCKLRESR